MTFNEVEARTLVNPSALIYGFIRVILLLSIVHSCVILSEKLLLHM